MPPKGATKAKAAGSAKAIKVKEPKTPERCSAETEEPQSPSPSKPKSVRKKKAPKVEKSFNPLSSAFGDTTPVEILYENETTRSKPVPSGFSQDLQLRAPQLFNVVTSIMIQEGEYKGHQAIIIAPSKPLPFMEFPIAARLLVYEYYFAPPIPESNNLGQKIKINGTAAGISAKEYSSQFKNRTALLGVCKDINNEARQILYNYTLKFDKLETLLTFLSCGGETVRQLLTNIELNNYSKNTAMPTLSLLGECHNIQRVHILSGLGNNMTPDKAQKAFFNDAFRFLKMIGTLRGHKMAGLECFSFGKACFTIADGGGKFRKWDEDETEEFTEGLRDRLK